MNYLAHFAQRWRRWLPWFMIVLGPLIIFAPALVQGRVLFWGAPILQFTPWHTLASRLVREGILPLWNPSLGFGAPLLANHQAALLYPPNWLVYLFDPAWVQTLLAMLHLIWAGIGMRFLLKRIGLQPLAQTVGAICFGLSGYLVSRSGFLSINATASWVPWIILQAHILSEISNQPNPTLRTRLKAVLLLGISLGLQWLAGHAQTAVYTLILTLAWFIWAADHPRRNLKRDILNLVGSILVGFLIASAQILPTLEYLLVSSRSSGLDMEFGLNYSFWPWRLLGLFAPTIFGHPAYGDYWGFGNYWEDDMYVGVLPILLVLFAVVGQSRTHQRLRWFLLIIGIGSFILALGNNTPIFPWLYHNIPGIDNFQAPTRWNLLTTFCLCVLAGIGLSQFREPQGKLLYWMRLGTAGAVAIGIAALLGDEILSELDPTISPAVTFGALVLALSGFLLLFYKWETSFLWSGTLLLLVTFDLARMGTLATPFISNDLHQGKSALTATVGTNHRLFMQDDIEQEIKFNQSFRFNTFEARGDWDYIRDVGLPNVSLLDGLSSANNFDPLTPARYQSFFDHLSQAPRLTQEDRLQLADVGWIASRHPTEPSQVTYLELDAPSRIRLVGQPIWVASTEEAMKSVFKPEFDGNVSVVLEGNELENKLVEGVIGEVEILDSKSPQQVDIQIHTQSGGWVVLSDQWYPGWHAFLDDEQVESYPANGAFRAVFVPAGDHNLVFTYRPISFILGAVLSLMAWIGVGLGYLKWRD